MIGDMSGTVDLNRLQREAEERAASHSCRCHGQGRVAHYSHEAAVRAAKERDEERARGPRGLAFLERLRRLAR